MTRPIRLVLIAAIAGGVFPVASATPCVASGEGSHHATIVIATDDWTRTFCVAFDGSSLTGLEALRRTGLPMREEDFGGGETAICAVDGVGCSDPSTSCFCRSSEDIFWGYYRQTDGAWTFSQDGVARTRVFDGAIEGWRYGRHRVGGGNPPAFDAQAPCLSPVAAQTDRGSPVALLVTLAASGLALVVLGAFAKRRIRGAR